MSKRGVLSPAVESACYCPRQHECSSSADFPTHVDGSPAHAFFTLRDPPSSQPLHNHEQVGNDHMMGAKCHSSYVCFRPSFYLSLSPLPLSSTSCNHLLSIIGIDIYQYSQISFLLHHPITASCYCAGAIRILPRVRFSPSIGRGKASV